ncbi:MAG: hypothetical protein JXA61_03195 [Bacteroidales bacterium]|nr:hypothetical protein [Bacteroidales bacterium]
MSYRYTIQAGLESLHEIEQLIREFPQQGEIPGVELDLVLQKIRNLYDIMLLLRQYQKEPKPDVHPETKPDVHPETKRDVHPETKRDVHPEPKPDVHMEPKPEFNSEIKAESKPELPEEEVASPSHKDEVPHGKEPLKDSASDNTGAGETKQEKEARILSERFRGRTSLYDSIHEIVSQKNGGSIGQSKPVVSITTAIGINDRFTFIKELFNNDHLYYEETIKVLDGALNFNEAYNYMIQNFDWDMDSEAVQMLLDVIRRKYITGRHE